ncbi:2-C-methyl-D-erythritol 2,4-cyclodiphosphate synthase [soil metagenome]
MRVGLGVDAHAFDESRPLVLGGVPIAESWGLEGHSDADVLSHAIADALLGATGLSDLGTSFPNDERWRDASSLTILEEVARVIAEAGWSIANVDATVIAERPRLTPYRDGMVDAVARALGVDRSDVWVKATTSDGLGFIGRSEGIAAIAVVLVERP